MRPSYQTLSSMFDSAIAEATPTKHVMRVMTPKDGDVKSTWDPSNQVEVDQIRKLFDEMKAKGLVAYRVGEKGKKSEVMTKFDPDAEAIIFAPKIVGG